VTIERIATVSHDPKSGEVTTEATNTDTPTSQASSPSPVCDGPGRPRRTPVTSGAADVQMPKTENEYVSLRGQVK